MANGALKQWAMSLDTIRLALVSLQFGVFVCAFVKGYARGRIVFFIESDIYPGIMEQFYVLLAVGLQNSWMHKT